MSIWTGRAMKNIVIFSGTTEGRTLSELLCENGIPHLISVATEYGKQLCPEHMLARVVQGRMNTEEMAAFLTKEQIDLVIDATHPYAVEVTENIRQAVLERSKQGQAVKYLRYVRETNADEAASVRSDTPFDDDACVHKSIEVSIEPNRMGTIQGVHKIHYYGSTEECEQALHSVAGNILLTTGSKELSVFCQSKELQRRLIVRVLPGQESIGLCEEQGLLGKQIIAMQGPFSEEMNMAIIRQYQVSCMVTKQSGRNGGFQEKLSAAAIAGIPVYVIGAPVQEAGSTLEEILSEIGVEEPKPELADEKHYETEESEQSVHENSEISTDKNAAAANEDLGYSERKGENAFMDIKLVGCGMGSADTLTAAAKQSIESADILLGAERLIRPYSARIEKRPYYLAKDIVPYLCEIQERCMRSREILQKENIQVLRVTILFSGDTGFYSGCEKLYAAIDQAIQDGKLAAAIRILPGISSVSYLAARLHTSWEHAAILSVHGKGDVSNWREELIQTVKEHDKTYLLVSRAKDVVDVYHILQELVEKRAMCAGYQLDAGYQLSYPEEQMIHYEITSSKDGETKDLNDLPEGLYICLIRHCM